MEALVILTRLLAFIACSAFVLSVISLIAKICKYHDDDMIRRLDKWIEGQRSRNFWNSWEDRCS